MFKQIDVSSGITYRFDRGVNKRLQITQKSLREAFVNVPLEHSPHSENRLLTRSPIVFGFFPLKMGIQV